MAVVNITRNPRPSFAWQNANCWQDGTRRAAIIARFWSLVDRRKANVCWPFGGYVATHGYGQFSFVGDGRQIRVRAHRFAWLLSERPLPAGCVLAHRCDNPRCVNPGHLRVTTQAENLHESIRKGRKRTWGVQKLNATQVNTIRRRCARGERQCDVAASYGIARNTVSQIVSGTTWAHLTPEGSHAA